MPFGAESDSDEGGGSPLDVLETLRRTNGARDDSDEDEEDDDEEDDEVGVGAGAAGSDGGGGGARGSSSLRASDPRDRRGSRGSATARASQALPPGWEVVDRVKPGTSIHKVRIAPPSLGKVFF